MEQQSDVSLSSHPFLSLFKISKKKKVLNPDLTNRILYPIQTQQSGGAPGPQASPRLELIKKPKARLRKGKAGSL